MNDSGGPSLDWDSIFQRARHHIVRRVILVGAVAAVGALLLFSGGTASWKVISHARKAKQDESSKSHHHKKKKKKSGHGGQGEGESGHGHGHRQKHHHHKPPPPPPCAGKAAVSVEYCEREAIRGP